MRRDFRFSILDFRFGVALATVVAGTTLIRAAEPTGEVLVVVGAPGEKEYAAGFATAAEAWRKACAKGGEQCTVIGEEESDLDDADASPAVETSPPASQDTGDKKPGAEAPDDRERLQSWLAAADHETQRPLWFAYLGHGTFDGKEARLNLRGPDVSIAELSAWLAPLHRPMIIVLGNSASGPFLPALSGPDHVVIAATESGNEVNYARFGERFADAVGDSAADLDQDGQTSVLEAYLSAARRVQNFYDEELRLATEHPLLDDNGDRHGTPPDWFSGTRATKKAEGGATPDGRLAHRFSLVESPAERALTPEQRSARNQLEDKLEQLRDRKDAMPERDYLRELEILMRRIGAIYAATPPTAEPPPPAAAPSPADTEKAGPNDAASAPDS